MAAWLVVVAVMYALHQDSGSGAPRVRSCSDFLPIGLAYHAGAPIAVSVHARLAGRAASLAALSRPGRRMIPAIVVFAISPPFSCDRPVRAARPPASR